ncbi:MAG: hypothetical protein WAU88_07720 [Candidatus Zixiibacteriota bacterium]
MRLDQHIRLTCVFISLALIATIMALPVRAGERFGDSSATNSRICSSNTLMLGKYQSAATGGTLDSLRFWARYNDGGTDTIVGCIYSASGTLLGRSTDSAIVIDDDLNPYMVRFTNQNISISGSTRYWLGVQMRASGVSTNTRLGSASPNDTLYLGTDVLPLESSIPSGSKYLGSAVEAIRVTAYYSVHSSSRPVARRRRSLGQLEFPKQKGGSHDQTIYSVACGADGAFSHL